MFAPGAEQLSKEEIRAGEQKACHNIRQSIFGAVLLYLSPFAVDFVKKFF